MSGKAPAVAADERVLIGPPDPADGAHLWRVARDSQKLDLNSSYAYLLWCRHFADTTVVARVGDEVAGFVIGYLRPRAPDTVVVWQVAIDASQRGKGLAGKLLDGLVSRLAERGVRYLETTVTPDNAPSIALFTAAARRWRDAEGNPAQMTEADFFAAADFPDEHEPEQLYRIGPFESGFAENSGREAGNV
jgi:L-2,4-diaminobutyric acid acetyltransferase